MRAYIHIGMPKTGTTFLQRGMRDTRDALRDHGVYYPDSVAGLGISSEATAAHHWLAHALRDRRFGYTPSADFAEVDTHVAAIKRGFADSGCTALVLSSEDFWFVSQRQAARLRRFF